MADPADLQQGSISRPGLPANSTLASRKRAGRISMEVPEPIFRAHKRRKVYRRRDDDYEDQTPASTSATSAPTLQQPGAYGHDCDGETEAEDGGQDPERDGRLMHDRIGGGAAGAVTIVRQRKPLAGKARRGGIAFSHTGRGSSLRPPSPSNVVALASPTGEREQDPKASMLETARSRFAPQTGTAVSEGGDAHMTAYIDAELERRRRDVLSPPSQTPRSAKPSDITSALASTSTPASTFTAKPPNEPHPTRQPAATGQIEEVHLPSGPNVQQHSPRKERQRPQRLGRDGKPLPPRRRKNRGSDDLARDAFVEAVMRENGLGVYDSGRARSQEGGDAGRDEGGKGRGTKAEEDADAMVAAQFEREYLESLEAQRRPEQPKMPGPSPGPRMKGEIDLLRGPKLGGSRSARAAMHAAEKERGKAKGK